MTGVSVVIPAYNAAHYIGATLDSVLAQQTARSVECIVVDDGSQDDTVPRVRAYGERVTLIQQSNAGPSSARNRGLAASAFPLVAFIDADDLMAPQRLELQATALEADPATVLCHSACQLIDAQGLAVDNQDPVGDDPGFSGEVCARLFRANFVWLSSVMLRKQAFMDAGAFDTGLRHCEDYEAWLRLSLRGRFKYLAQALVSYRLHPQQATRQAARLNVGRVQARELFLGKCPAARDALGARFIGQTFARVALDLGYASLRAGDLTAARWILRRGLAHSPASAPLAATLAKSYLPGFLRRGLGRGGTPSP